MPVALPEFISPNCWPRRAVLFDHDLRDNELLSPEGIRDWVGSIPSDRIQQHQGELPVLHPSGAVRTIKEPTAEVIADLGTRNVWIQIQGIGHAPHVDALAEESERTWRVASAALEGGLRRRAPTLLVASPGAAVPAHFDRQHLLLHQISGSKELFLGGAPTDGGLDPEVEGEVFESMSHRSHNLYELPTTVRRFHLRPGIGLYIPPRTPHWVLGGGDESISFSCGWETVWSESEYLTYYFNARLRRWKIPSGPVVAGHWSNQAKAAVVRGTNRLRRSKGSKATADTRGDAATSVR